MAGDGLAGQGMFLDLTRIHGPREHVERVCEATALDASADDFRVVSEIRLSFDVEKKDRRYRLTGRAATTLELTCSRCLERFSEPFDVAFDAAYLPQSANTGEGEIEVAEDDLDTGFYEDERIDLGQLVREQIYLALPMKPLCVPACLGLCPVCGASRNAGACGCQSSWDDPRLAPLKKLLQTPDQH